MDDPRGDRPPDRRRADLHLSRAALRARRPGDAAGLRRERVREDGRLGPAHARRPGARARGGARELGAPVRVAAGRRVDADGQRERQSDERAGARLRDGRTSAASPADTAGAVRGGVRALQYQVPGSWYRVLQSLTAPLPHGGAGCRHTGRSSHGTASCVSRSRRAA